MLNNIRTKAIYAESTKSEQPTSQILSPVGSRRMFQFIGNSENKNDFHAGYQSLKGTEGNFSADKDCVFLRPDSSSLNEEIYLENDFPQNNQDNLADISRIDDFMLKQQDRFSKEENSLEEYENYLKPYFRQQVDINNDFRPKESKTAGGQTQSSGKTTSYQANCLVLGYQDKIFPDQSRPTSQELEEEDQNMQLILGNSRFQPESSPPLSAAENSFMAMKNNFMKQILSNLPSKITSNLSSVKGRGKNFDFDQSGLSGGLVLQSKQPSHVKTQRTDKDRKQINHTEQIINLNRKTRNKTNSQEMDAKKFTMQPPQINGLDVGYTNKYEVPEFAKNLNTDSNNDQTLREQNIYPEKYIQEPDDEEEHIVQPFEVNSETSDSCVPIKEEIVSAISSRKNHNDKLQLVDLSDIDNIRLIYNSNQSGDGEPEVQEINISQIVDPRSAILHKQTDRELDGISPPPNESNSNASRDNEIPRLEELKTPEHGTKLSSYAFAA